MMKLREGYGWSAVRSVVLAGAFLHGGCVMAAVIARQDFETSPATPTATYSASGGALITGSSASGDRPASSTHYSEGAQAYNVNNGTATLTFDAIDTSGYTAPTLTVRLASFSVASTGNGADGADYAEIQISPDNGANYYPTVRVAGNANAYWHYSTGSGLASTGYDGDGTVVSIAPAGGGNRTTDGYSTMRITGLPSVSQLRIKVILFNNAGGERWCVDDLQLTGEASVTEPSTQASSVSFASVQTTQLDVSWTSGNGANRLVICRQGSAPSGGPVDGTSYTADANFGGSGSALGSGKVVYSGSGSSFTLTGLSPSTTYHLQVFEFNGSGASANYLTSTASGNPNSQTTQTPANSTDSDIIRAAGFTEPANVAYASYQAADISSGNSIEVARFTIRDGGGASDSDATSTTLDAITLSVANSASLRRLALYDGSTEIAEVAGGASAVFSGLSGLVAADGGTKDFSVRATFLATVTDNQQLQFTVSSASANAGGSTFAAGNAGAAASDITGDANRLEVTATKLVFTSTPGSVAVAENFSASVQARDANENVDLDSAASVTITKATGSGTLTGGGAQSLSSGAQSWASLQIDSSGTITLQAAGGSLSAGTSSNIVAIGKPLAISGYFANPAGNDGPYEYVQVIALEAVDFSVTPMSMVIANNGTATANGWIAGAALSYKFNITSGSLNAGDVAYIGGSGKLINGSGSTDISGQTWLRSIDTSTTAGDGFGSSGGTGGNMGNGGGNADGIALFVGTSPTDTSVPVDALFYGTAIGSALVSSGTDGYVVPVSDLYSGGFLQSGSTFFPDPVSGVFTKLNGVYNTVSKTWTTARTASTVSSPTAIGDIATGISLATPAAEPTSQATSVSFSSVQSVQMGVSWTSGNGANRLVICRQGSAPASGPVDGTTYTADADFSGAGSALGSGKVVYIGSGSSFTLTGLSPSTTYYLEVYEFNGTGVNINYLTSTATGNPNSQATTAPPNATDSDVVRATGFTEPANIAYHLYQGSDITDANSIEVGRYTIRDGGAGIDSDAMSTTLDAIHFTVVNAANLRRVALYDGTTEIAEVAGGATLHFIGLAGLAAADGSTKDFSLRATFLSSVGDNQQLQFTVTGATANASGSIFATANAGGAATDLTGDANRIEITATKLVFSSVPAGVYINSNFTATAQARDANENIDVDSTASVTITKASGSGSLSGGGAQNLASGVQSWSALQIDTAGTFTLQASGGSLTAAASGNLSASTGPTTLAPGDIVVLGYNTAGSPNDDLAILILKDLNAGTTFYVNDNEIAADGGSSFSDLAEKEAAFTVKAGQTIVAGTVIVLPWGGSAVSTSTYDWDASGGGFGANNEEIYVYAASAITDTTPSGFIYGVRIGTSSSARPNGLSAGTTWITPPPSGSLSASRYKTSGAVYTGTVATLRSVIGDIASNWESAATYTMTDTDWTFALVTPASEPSTQAASISFGNVQSTDMDISWTSGNGATRLVVCRQGAAPSGDPVDGTTYTADASFTGSGTSLGGGKVVYVGSGSSFTLTDLLPSTTYHLRVYEFNGSGAAINYLASSGSGNPNSSTTASSGNSAGSDIARAGGFTEPANVDYAAYQGADITTGNSIELARFVIRDGGGSADVDAAATTLEALSFTVQNGANLRRIALYDGATEIAEVAGGATASFSGLAGLVAADDASKEFSVRASFLSTVTDNQQIRFTIASAAANVVGSSFAAANAGSAASDVSGHANRIEVTASKLAFFSTPSTAIVAQSFSAVVQARDASENVDLDDATSVTISKASGSGALTGGAAQNLSSGVQTWSSLQIDTAGTITLQAAGGALTSATSSNIMATALSQLTPGDVAIVGWVDNGSPNDAFAIVLLTNVTSGQTIYFTDNGWSNGPPTGFRAAAANDGAGSETLMKLVVHTPLSAGTILQSTNSASSSWTWVTSGAVPGGSGDSFSHLSLNTGGDQIYAFQAANSLPLQNPSGHLFVLDDTAGFDEASGTGNGNIPPGLSSNAGTAVSLPFSSANFIAIDMAKAATNTLTTKAGWLAFIANTQNWISAASGALPAGSLNYGQTCNAGLAPVIVLPASTTVQGGNAANFTVLAHDPTCIAPSLVGSILPSGSTFTTNVAGTNRIGTFSWSTTTNDYGVHQFLVTASDGILTTQKVIQVFVSQPGESVNGSGIPVTLTNWAVPITNFAEGSSGNATLVWQSVSGIPYDIYATSNTLGVGGTVWEKVGSVTAGAAQAAAVLAAGTTQKFFQVVPAGALPSSNGVWGAVQPVIPPGFSMFSAPLSGDRRFNGAFGAALGDVMTGDAGGEGDRAYYLLPNGSWDYVYLDDAGVWRDSLGGASALVLDPGQGVLFRRTGPTAVQPYFSGPVGNTGTSTNTVVEGWNVIGLSEGRGLYIQDAFDATAEGVAYGDYDETVSDMYVFLDSSGYWHRIQRLPDGSWFDLTRYQTATFYLLPGQAGYYFRSVGQGSLKVKF